MFLDVFLDDVADGSVVSAIFLEMGYTTIHNVVYIYIYIYVYVYIYIYYITIIYV